MRMETDFSTKDTSFILDLGRQLLGRKSRKGQVLHTHTHMHTHTHTHTQCTVHSNYQPPSILKNFTMHTDEHYLREDNQSMLVVRRKFTISCACVVVHCKSTKLRYCFQNTISHVVVTE